MARRPAAPQAIVIFGASGDLTQRKLLPAFFHLYLEGMLPNGSRSSGTPERSSQMRSSASTPGMR